MTVTAAALAVISCVPELSGAYTSWPMIALWSATCLTALSAVFLRRMWHRVPVFLLHLSLALILAGALLTHMLGTSETVHFRVGDTRTIGDSGVTLIGFDVVYYPGTPTPADFVSTLSVASDTLTTSMNRPCRHDGMTYFQSGYDRDGLGSSITVSSDPWGESVTYTGYVLLLAAMVWTLISHGKARRVAALAALCVAAHAQAAPRTLPREVTDSLADVCIYHNGRVAPLSTAVRDFTVKVTGDYTYDGLTAGQFASAWLFNYDAWRNEPCILIKDASVRERLGLNGDRAALSDFFGDDGRYLLDDARPEYRAANEQFGLVSAAAAGSFWKIFPFTSSDGHTIWLSPVDERPADMPLDKWHFTAHSLNYLAELAATGQYQTMAGAIAKTAAYQHREVPRGLPSPLKIRCERFFMACAPLLAPALLLLIGGLSLFFAGRGTAIATALCGAGALWTAALIAAAWTAGGRVPMSNGYETMQWMALAACCYGLCSRQTSLAPLCLVTAGAALLVARMGHSTPQVTQIVPVLRSPLLSVHVLTVMLGYTGLAVTALSGAAWLAGRREPLARARRLLMPSVFLLTAGIFIGTVWAGQSWGRYWGWDPKETWALITMLVYSLPLHASSLPAFRRDRFFAVYVLTAFLTVLMTYFGVNFVLGGLHGYA
ncbi:MAG: cytochrome c biogenesis protein CcsA [Muribaculaceae bacterium]|nr:cytochrome c biogenesis protein CcsA [Muribaculaceae bacterium]